MEPPNLVKVVAAFVAGVVIALGSALIYVRVSEMVHRQPVALAQTTADYAAPVPATQLPGPGQGSTQASTGDQAAEPAPPAPIQQAKKPRTKLVMRREVRVATPRKQQPKIAMAQLAAYQRPVNEPTTYAAPPQNDAPPPEPPPAAEIPAQVPDAAPPIPQPHVITLQAGTALPIRLSETVSSDHNYTGDTFRGTLEAPIVMDGFVIADRGSKVLGRVVSSEKAGRMQGAADLSLTLTEINTTDGQRIHVDTNSFDRRGASSTGEEAAKIAGGAALGAIIGAAAGGGKGAAIGAGVGGAAGTGLVFATGGKAAALPVETRLTFRLATPLTITEKLN